MATALEDTGHENGEELAVVPRSFDRVLLKAYRRSGANLRQRAQLRHVLRGKELDEELGTSMRNMLAVELTTLAVSVGAIKPASENEQIVQGIFVGDWADIWQLIFENLPMIFEWVIKIIMLFI